MFRVTILESLDLDEASILRIEFEDYEEAKDYATKTIANTNYFVRLDYIENETE